MTRSQLALLVGGLLPAILLGFSGVAQKLSATGGIGSGPFLIVTGIATTILGVIFGAVGRDWDWTPSGGGYAVLFGICWATGTGCIAIALKKYGGQISQLVPLYNMNTLVAVMIGLAVFAEWRVVSPLKILIAAALIIAGGIIASRA